MKKFLIFLFLIFNLITNHYVNADEVTENKIKNFTYHLTFGNHTVTLKNGEYKKNFPEYMYVWIDQFVIRDINGDNLSDAVVILGQTGGGSGGFYEITTLMTKKNSIVQTNSVVLGDRVEINKLEVNGGHFNGPPLRFEPPEIIIDMLTHKESDPSCCPSEKKTKCFTIFKNKLISCEKAPQPRILKKPAIYLYPETTQKIDVSLNINGEMTESIPKYNQGWSVTVTPDGKINEKFDYLFYEAKLSNLCDLPEEGWLVPYDRLEEWFDKYLILLGLNKNEASDFKNYWLNKLKTTEYYIIKVLDRQFVDRNLSLNVKPIPQTVIRVILYFEATDQFRKIKEPDTVTPERKGFTLVEWGGIAEDMNDADIKLKSAYSFLPTDTGTIVLRALKIEDHRVFIKINTGGCTDKKSLRAYIKKVEGVDSQVSNYEIIFKRETADFCKAFLPEGVVIEYDLKNDFDFKMPYTIEIKNPIIPMNKNEPFFIISSIRNEIPIEIKEHSSESEHNEMTLLKKELIDATVKAIELEIERYRVSNHKDKEKKIAYLQKELVKFKKIKAETYIIGNFEENNILGDSQKFGPLIPPELREIEITVTKGYNYGSILEIKGMTRSGPFYHIAGIKSGDFKYLTPGKYKVYLVYKREYFGLIPDYYVYIGEKK